MNFLYFCLSGNILISPFFFFWPHCVACGILVSQPGIKSGALAVRVLSPNHWTAREFPLLHFFSFFLSFFFFFWLCWVFVAAHRLSLVVVSGGYSSLWCADFSLQWLLLLQSTGSRHAGFSGCGARA